MFLNLPQRNKRLSLDFGLPRSKSYLSTLNNTLLNKQKSYSTASLKQEFKQFKNNKSLSYFQNSNNHGISGAIRQQQQVPRLYTPSKKVSFVGNSYINNNVPNNTGPLSSGLKLNDFKKTYLNLDTKLNKTTKKQKDYFRPIQEHYNNNNRYTPQSPTIFNKKQNQQNNFPSTYLQVQKRLQQQSSRRSVAQMTEINELRQFNQLLRRQNQELKKQRAIDLDLIARQNEIMQKQEQLIEANQQAIYINKMNITNRRQDNMNESKAFTFSHQKPKVSLHICEQCKKRKQYEQMQNRQDRQTKVQKEFLELKIEKMAEEKKLLKKQIHQLVYQSENYKQSCKKAQEKYQKQFQHNQKLLKIIENMLQNHPSEKISKHQSQNQYQQSINGINRQPYLNLLSSKDRLQENQPISIKKDKIKNQFKNNKYQSEINSPMQRLHEKNVNFKSASNLIKFNNSQQNYENQWRIKNNISNEQSRIRNYYKQKQNIRQKEMQKERFSLRWQIQKQKEKNLQWCQNQNIRKYLNEINQQKIKEIDQIQSLLSTQQNMNKQFY